MFVQTFIKLNAAVQELSCWQTFSLSRNGEKSENPVLRPWPLTYNLDIQQGSSGCQGTFSFIKLSAAVYELSW